MYADSFITEVENKIIFLSSKISSDFTNIPRKEKHLLKRQIKQLIFKIKNITNSSNNYICYDKIAELYNLAFLIDIKPAWDKADYYFNKSIIVAPEILNEISFGCIPAS